MDMNLLREEDKLFSKHATEVASVMVGARNGEDGVGVAYNATLASYWVGVDTKFSKNERL